MAGTFDDHFAAFFLGAAEQDGHESVSSHDMDDLMDGEY